MHKKLFAVAAAFAAASMLFAGGGKDASAAKPAAKASAIHIGVVTGTVSQSEDDLRGAEELIKRYGAVKDGGMIQHITYPDDFMSQQETTISQIVALADDPAMKATYLILP